MPHVLVSNGQKSRLPKTSDDNRVAEEFALSSASDLALREYLTLAVLFEKFKLVVFDLSLVFF